MLRGTAAGIMRFRFFAMLSSDGAAASRGINRCVRSGFRIAIPPSAPGAAAVWRRRVKTSWMSERMLTSGMRGAPPGAPAAGPSAARGCDTPCPSTQSEKSGLLDKLIGSLRCTTRWITANPAADGGAPANSR